MRPHVLLSFMASLSIVFVSSHANGAGWVLARDPYGPEQTIGMLDFEVRITNQKEQPFFEPKTRGYANNSSFKSDKSGWSYLVEIPEVINKQVVKRKQVYQSWQQENKGKKTYFLASDNSLFKVADGVLSGTNCAETTCHTVSPSICANLKSINYFHTQQEIDALETELIELQIKKDSLVKKKHLSESEKKDLIFVQDQIRKKRSMRDLYNFNNNFGQECATLLRDALKQYREILIMKPADLAEADKNLDEINKIRKSLKLPPLRDLNRLILDAETGRALEKMDVLFDERNPNSLGWKLQTISLQLQEQLRDCEQIGWYNDRTPILATPKTSGRK